MANLFRGLVGPCQTPLPPPSSAPLVPLVTQALVFAAGPAQRLLPLTENRPKGMLIIGGRPLLQHAVEALRAHGINDIVMVVGPHGEKIQAFFKDGSDFKVRIRYVHQAEPTGTMQAVRLALPELDLAKPVLILPGHAYVEESILRPVATATETTVLVATAGHGHVQGVPLVRGARLAGMRHEVPAAGSSRVTTNIVLAGPELLAALKAQQLAGQKEFDLALGEWAAAGAAVQVVATEGPWFPVVGPWDVLRLNEWVLENHLPPSQAKAPAGSRGKVSIGHNCHIAPTAVLIGPTSIGDGCTVEDGAVVGPYVSVRNGCVIGAHCEVRRSILNNNVLLDSRALLRGSILDDGVQVGPGLICDEITTPTGPHGCIIGRDARIAPRTTLQGGSVVDVEHGLRA